MNLPNAITLARIIMVPVMVAIFLINAIPYNYLIAAIIFSVAALTDFFDGYLARKKGLVTNLGKFLDAIADKVLVSVAMVLLILIAPNVYNFVIWITLCVIIVLIRDLIVNAIRMMAASNNVVMAADKSGKIKTAFQCIAIPILMAAIDVGALLNFDYMIMYYIGFALMMVAVILTVISGVHYFIKGKEFLFKTK